MKNKQMHKLFTNHKVERRGYVGSTTSYITLNRSLSGNPEELNWVYQNKIFAKCKQKVGIKMCLQFLDFVKIRGKNCCRNFKNVEFCYKNYWIGGIRWRWTTSTL